MSVADGPALVAAPPAEPADWIPILAGAVPRDSRVLILGAFPRELLDGLHARGCRVTLGGERQAAAAVERAQGEIDAVLIPALHGPAIDRALVAARRLLGETGRVVALVRNAGYAVHRLDILRGDLGRLDVPALLLPLDAVEELLGEAGLAVIERLPVTRRPQLDITPALREELLAHPDALAWAHVLVAIPMGRTPAGTDASVPLRRSVEELTARVTALDAMLRDRIGELEAVHAERRHLELDVEVKDAFIGELLDRISALEVDLSARVALDAELWKMTRYRIADALHARLRAVPALHQPLRAAARWQRDRARHEHDG